MPRRLSPEERTLWARVIESVSPLHAAKTEPILPETEKKKTLPEPVRPSRPQPPPEPVRARLGTTLDGTWDRRLGRGLVQPEMSVDLHGHNLATAYALLDDSLDRAISQGIRLLLLITGKPPKGEPPVARGRIRAAVGDWLAASRHAGNIAAVRAAHQRHGGAGALYIVLRRGR
jgi:DNA-nicking Smr family endonuclease